MPPQRYKYVPIGGQYYCLNQNPLFLAWFLFFKKWSPQHLSGSRKRSAIKTAIKLVLHQLYLYNNSNALELSECGNLYLPVHRGCKVFDFYKKTVTKIMAPGVDSAMVMREIESVRKAGSLSFAPSLLRWDIKERWYKEEFMIGYPLYSKTKARSDVFLSIFDRHIAPYLEEMILLQAPVRINLSEHIKKTIKITEDNIITKAGLETDKVNYIKRYVKEVSERLSIEENSQIDLIFSHGDFSLVNILKTKKNIMVIDWEGGKFRNPLFDLYNYFLTELYYERATCTSGFVLEINKAITYLQARLLTKVPDLAKTLTYLTPLYHRLYYLERICMLLERELSNKLLSVIVRSIEVFNRYEEVIETHKHP